MKMSAFVDEEVYKPEASAGAWNAYYSEICEAVDHRPAYFICLNKIMAYERDGKLSSMHDCEAQIGRGHCPALKMRSDEKAAGKAIYFVNREKLNAFTNKRDEDAALNKREEKVAETRRRAALPVPAPGDYNGFKRDSVQPATKSVEVPQVKIEHFLEAQVGGYADAINASIKASAVSEPVVEASKSPEVKTVQATPQASVSAGMSLIEIARMRIAAKAV
jgi:hypothetical protein